MIELPFPAKVLWPNGRTKSFHFKNREFQKHKSWARNATLAAYRGYRPDGAISWLVTVYPKTRHPIDKDNASASLKAYQDGIASALQIDDSQFDTPVIQFGEPVKDGKFVIILETETARPIGEIIRPIMNDIAERMASNG